MISYVDDVGFLIAYINSVEEKVMTVEATLARAEHPQMESFGTLAFT